MQAAWLLVVWRFNDGWRTLYRLCQRCGFQVVNVLAMQLPLWPDLAIV